MGHGMKALALAAVMLIHSTTADAIAWKAKGYYYFVMDIEEAGFKGEARLEYSGRLTPALIEEGLTNEGAWFKFEIKHGLRGWDRVNNGPWIPLIPPPGGFSPTVYLDVDDFCNPAEYDDCSPPGPSFLQPVGAWNFDGWGQFDFIRADGVGAYARFPGGFCDWDSYGGTCNEGEYDFVYGHESSGTFQEVAEPSVPALLSVGLFWLVALRRRAALNPRWGDPFAVLVAVKPRSGLPSSPGPIHCRGQRQPAATAPGVRQAPRMGSFSTRPLRRRTEHKRLFS